MLIPTKQAETQLWIPFPALQAAGDDTLDEFFSSLLAAGVQRGKARVRWTGAHSIPPSCPALSRALIFEG